jgi:hypothetical protein
MGPGQNPEKTKKSLARKIVVADADGIFEESGEINFEMIDALEDLAGEYPVYLVSSRPESAAKSILADLEEFEIKIEKSMFSTFPAGSGDHYKKYVASIIAREGNEVVCTIGAVGDGLSGLSEKSIEISKADGKINLDVPAAVKAEAQRGLEARFLSPRFESKVQLSQWTEEKKRYEARLEDELNMIAKTGFAGYFLIVADFINWAKRNGMPESVTDRFTKKHEYVFFMVKNEKYYFDLDIILYILS